jgi:protein PhnA
MVCNTCIDQIENPDNIDLNHWRCLNDSMERTYSGTSCRVENVAVCVQLDGPQELLDQMYLDEDTLAGQSNWRR